MTTAVSSLSKEELETWFKALDDTTKEITKDRETAYNWLKDHGFLRHLDHQQSGVEETAE